jgi:class 3 adenylate cyclase
MAAFQSAVNAVSCALEIQQRVAADNAALPPARRMQLRIGVNLGDVIEEKGSLFGDAVNVAARLQGAAAPPFHYRHYGLLATIGRMAAVVDLGRLHFSGLLAWWFWLLAHVYFLIGFRNRIMVLIDWASAYWTYQRGARIVTGRSRRPS